MNGFLSLWYSNGKVVYQLLFLGYQCKVVKIKTKSLMDILFGTPAYQLCVSALLVYVSAPPLLCVSIITHTMCVSAVLRIISALWRISSNRSSTYQLFPIQGAYQAFCVSASCINSSMYKYQVFRVLCAYRLFLSTYQRLFSSGYYLFCVSAPCINLSTYQVLRVLYAYRLFYVLIPPQTVYVLVPPLCTVCVSIPLHTVYVSALLLFCVLSIPHTRCVLASVFVYCLNCLAYQLFLLTFLYIKSSVYCVRASSFAYQFLCVSALLNTVYVSSLDQAQ